MQSFGMRPLGKTGFNVSPLGIGGGGGIQAEDLLYAFDHGINYFFHSSDLHHFRYSQSVAALRQLCGHGSSVRNKVILATVSYINDPRRLHAAIVDQFLELGIDYIDIFHWGWIYDERDAIPLLKVAQQLKNGQSDLTRSCRRYAPSAEMVEQANQVNSELVAQGLVRAVGMSFHSRRAALALIHNIDVMMLRYNIAQTEIENTVFAALSGDKRVDPGIVVFNAAHADTRFFHMPPPGYPTNLPAPTIPDCYRFALSNPAVDIVLTGVENRFQIDQALTATTQGPLDSEEYEFLREYGSIFTLPQL